MSISKLWTLTRPAFALVSRRTMSTPTSDTNTTDAPLFASPQEERKWNQLSAQMSNFHNYFKQEFNQLYKLADGSYERRGLSLTDYLDTARSLDHHLTMHHTIEERFFFPRLAKKLPQFDKNSQDRAHLESHEGIHQGLVNLMALVSKFEEDQTSYSPVEMRACLDSFRDVLFNHLDEEVEDLKGSNLKKHFTLQEFNGLLMH
ncbi:hypothetical protein CPB83DRAFT_852521 [Crepidotus variabilis]|uniref:Hemerythrin-like domain-containing protein n=1 Tax=Crepidotus variabilis TaxID=179855 RepID=A0A9P6JR36_9AGAR|nr:hypothetical protein CPB83DRAFT_852521 [Crepidotus variabilis]